MNAGRSVEYVFEGDSVPDLFIPKLIALFRLAGKAGLDMERYTREMREGVYAARVEKDFKAALYGDAVTGTPTLYLKSVRLSNIQSIEVLLVAVTEAGAILKADFNQQATWRSRLRRLRVGMTHFHSDSKS